MIVELLFHLRFIRTPFTHIRFALVFCAVALGICAHICAPFLAAQSGGSRQQQIVDSLAKQLQSLAEGDSARISLLLRLSKEYTSYDAAVGMKYGEQALELANKLGLQRNVALAKNAVGVSARIQGLYAVAATLHFDALTVSKTMNDEEAIARALHNIGRVYEVQRENNKALEYFRQALVIRENLANLGDIGETMHYMGNCFGNQRQFDSAMRYFARTLLIREEIYEARGIATTTNNIGWLLRLQERYDTALVLFRRAYSVFDSLDDTRGKALTLDNIGVVYFQQKNYSASIKTLEQALRYAEISHDRREVNDLYAALANSNEAAGDFREANQYRRLCDALKDSLFNERSSKLVAELSSRHEDEKREQQVKIIQLDASQSRLLSGIWGLLALSGLIAIGFLWYNNRSKAKVNAELQQKQAAIETHSAAVEAMNLKMLDVNHELSAAYEQADTLNNHLTDTLQALQFEKANADGLLLNILPSAIAERLKNGERSFAQRYSSTTIVFADLVGFTQLAASMAPEELVQILSEVFVMFDNVLEHNGCEKIKTIGDCYMMASGLTVERPDHAVVAARTAFELLIELTKFNEMFRTEFRLRIGMHTGPVVAGVIGRKKFAFDIWGDTVNIASRMESHGEADKIHCTEDIYAALHNTFLFEERGHTEIKGRGSMRTYFLVGESKNEAQRRHEPMSIEL
jgi:adenylate cyclase